MLDIQTPTHPHLPQPVRLNKEVLEEVLTHQAVCLAELGEVTMAIDLARSALAADRFPRR